MLKVDHQRSDANIQENASTDRAPGYAVFNKKYRESNVFTNTVWKSTLTEKSSFFRQIDGFTKERSY